MANIFFSY